MSESSSVEKSLYTGRNRLTAKHVVALSTYLMSAVPGGCLFTHGLPSCTIVVLFSDWTPLFLAFFIGTAAFKFF